MTTFAFGQVRILWVFTIEVHIAEAAFRYAMAYSKKRCGTVKFDISESVIICQFMTQAQRLT